MDFALSSEQGILKTTARKFLEKECPRKLVREIESGELGYSPELWCKMADIGWTGLPFPEENGGSEGSFLDLMVLMEEMGRACLPAPYASTVIGAGLTILDYGSEPSKGNLLTNIATGDLICSIAFLEPSDSYDPKRITCQAIRTQTGYIINGTKLFVADVNIADYLLVVARIENQLGQEPNIILILVNMKSEGITYTPLKTIAADKQFEVQLKNVNISHSNLLVGPQYGDTVFGKILQRITLAKCAEMVGGMQEVLDMSVKHSNERVQFGQPIGSFQIIQHYCADMATDTDAARFITYKAAWMMSEGMPCEMEVALAKAWVSEAYRRVTSVGHQVHGTIAFTRDMDLELYVRRAKAAEVAFGNADFQREKIAEHLGL